MDSSEKLPFWESQTLILEAEDRATYYTRIIAVKDNSIFIQYPVNKNNEPMNQSSYKQVTVNFFGNLKERCVFDTRLEYDGRKLYFAVPAADSIHKVQRRNHFRVPAFLEFWLETQSGVRSSIITDDISGGGMAFFSPNAANTWKSGEVVSGGIRLDKKNETAFTAKIADIRTDANGHERVALEFIDMKEPQRNKIIQFCLQRQIEMRNI